MGAKVVGSADAAREKVRLPSAICSAFEFKLITTRRKFFTTSRGAAFYLKSTPPPRHLPIMCTGYCA